MYTDILSDLQFTRTLFLSTSDITDNGHLQAMSAKQRSRAAAQLYYFDSHQIKHEQREK